MDGQQDREAMIIIRDAIPEDGNALSTLLDQLGYPGTESFIMEKITSLRSMSDARLLVAVLEDRVVGVIALHFIPQIALQGDFARISYFVVEEVARSRGIGRKLEKMLEALARERGCDRIEVHCHSRRVDAHRFYLNLGYEEVPKYFIKKIH